MQPPPGPAPWRTIINRGSAPRTAERPGKEGARARGAGSCGELRGKSSHRGGATAPDNRAQINTENVNASVVVIVVIVVIIASAL